MACACGFVCLWTVIAKTMQQVALLTSVPKDTYISVPKDTIPVLKDTI